MPFTLSLLFFSFFLASSPAYGWQWQPSCDDVLSRGSLNVLTINMLYADFEGRSNRNQIITNFIVKSHSEGNPIDIILLQEVVGGVLSETHDNSIDLKNSLRDKGLFYNQRSRFYFGDKNVVRVGNAILSRCGILYTLNLQLPTIQEKPFPFLTFSFTRNVMMSRVQVPGYGGINVFNTHLCAYCTAEERLSQVQALIHFIDISTQFVWWENSKTILGGDFNIDRQNRNNETSYQEIINNGFRDSYAAYYSCDLCCNTSDQINEGCTYGTFGNPYGGSPSRLDYIFHKNLFVEKSDIVFDDSFSWVSDHSAVLTRFEIQ